MDQLQAVKLFYSNRDGLVELEDDVLSIVRQVRDLTDNRVRIHVDPQSGEFVFVEYCEDGEERLIFTVDELDQRAVERLLSADSRSRGYVDTYDAAEAEQDALHKAIDDQARETMYEHGERVAHALRKDGADTPMPLKVYIPGKAGWDT